MVDWKSENTLATPSIDINRVQILERRAYVIEALELYYKYKLRGAKPSTQEVRSRLASLFWELQETLYRKFAQDERLNYYTMKDWVTNINTPFNNVLDVWETINLMLGQINLTKIDNKEGYDSTNTELENLIQKL
jgi:hypothetical protein